MAQKFIGLDAAATQLGATKDQLNALREAGELRAYRDGASWKFRTEDINTLAEQGLPSASGESSGDSISLDALSEGLESDSLDVSDELSIDLGDIDLGDIDLDDADKQEPATPEPAASPPESDLELAGPDDDATATGEPEVAPAAESASAEMAAEEDIEIELAPAADEQDEAESILLTDASLGESPERPPSTIIGKSELAEHESDLQLASDSGKEAGAKAAMSDVRVVPDDEQAEGDDADAAAAASQFEGLEELEIDLEAESSRILEAEDVAAAQEAAKKAAADRAGAVESDLSLAAGSEAGLTGLSKLAAEKEDEFEIESAIGDDSGSDPAGAGIGEGPGSSSAVLSDDEDDDFVLGDSDSDVTLSGADSGINLAPADSGLALDDASLDLSGATGGSSLDLSESFGAVLTDGTGASDSSIASDGVSGDQDFLLQPVSEEESDVEEDSSQIIALEEVTDEDEDEVILGPDVVGFPVTVTEPGVAAADEAQFGALTISLLACSVAVMAVCGMLSVDMIRTVWSWEEPSSISSGVLDSLSSLMGL